MKFLGDEDTTVPIEQSDLLEQQFQQMGIGDQVEYYVIQGAGHGILGDKDVAKVDKNFVVEKTVNFIYSSN